MVPVRLAVLLLVATCPMLPAYAQPVAPKVAGADKAGARWALLVGVDDYLWARKLEYCGADMRALRQQLAASGFAQDHIYLLHDKAEENKYRPMKANIEAHLRLILDLAAQDDAVLIAFSGHGVHRNGRSYLCPAEAKLDDVNSLVAVDELYERLHKSPAALKLFLLDACRNDPRPDGQRSFTAGEDTRQFAQAVERPPQGILLLTSCAPEEIAREDKQFGHGVFMHFLLEGLRGAADANRNQRISLMELYLYTNEKTKTYVAQKFVDSQRPALKGDIHDDFDLFAVNTLGSLPVAGSTGSRPTPAQPAGDTITNSLGMRLVAIPAGEFTMGSPPEEIERLIAQSRALGLDAQYLDLIRSEGPQHRVRIARRFHLGVHEVTFGQFRQFASQARYVTEAERDRRGGIGFVAGNDDFARRGEFTWRNPGFPQDDEHPVVLVSWNDANQFCQWLTLREGRTYRLPTEAEWEYACRARTQTRYYSGDDPQTLAQVANTADARAKARFPGWELTIAGNDGHVFTAPVGSYPANPFGLHDMHGNVSEWCADWFGQNYYLRSPGEDPLGPDTPGLRVLRGGCWNSRPQYARCADRGGCEPSDRSCVTGFRVVLVSQ